MTNVPPTIMRARSPIKGTRSRMPSPKQACPVAYQEYARIPSCPGAMPVSLVQLATFCLRHCGLLDIPGILDAAIGRAGMLMVMHPDTPVSRDLYEERAILYLALMSARHPQIAVISGRVHCQTPDSCHGVRLPAKMQTAINTVGGAAMIVDPALSAWRYQSEPFAPALNCPRLLVAVLEHPQPHQPAFGGMRHHYIVLWSWSKAAEGTPSLSKPASIPSMIQPSPSDRKTPMTLATILNHHSPSSTPAPEPIEFAW